MTKRKRKQISHKYHRNRAREALREWIARVGKQEGVTFWICLEGRTYVAIDQEDSRPRFPRPSLPSPPANPS